MDCLTYSYPLPVVPGGPRAYTVCATLPHRSPCRPPDLLTDPCTGWAAQLCPADVDYRQPFAAGDVLTFQWQLPDAFNAPDNLTHGWKTGPSVSDWLLAVSVFSLDDQDITPLDFNSFASGWVGAETDGSRRQGLQIATDALPDCFRLRFTLNTPDGPVHYFTEPYARLSCNDTVLLTGSVASGTYATCDGFLLGDAPANQATLGTYFGHEFRLRLPAELAWTGTDLAHTRLKNDVLVGVSRTERYRLRSQRLPPYVVRHLQQLLAAPVIRANGHELQFEGSLGRNAERGTMWLIDTELQTPACKAAIGCN